jgi:hypothetical protein
VSSRCWDKQPSLQAPGSLGEHPSLLFVVFFGSTRWLAPRLQRLFLRRSMMPPTTVPADVTAAADVDSAARTDGLGVRCHAASTVEAHGRSATMRGKMRSGAMRGEVPVCAVGRDVRRPPIGQVMLDMGGVASSSAARGKIATAEPPARWPRWRRLSAYAARGSRRRRLGGAARRQQCDDRDANGRRPAANDAGDGTRARHLFRQPGMVRCLPSGDYRQSGIRCPALRAD